MGEHAILETPFVWVHATVRLRRGDQWKVKPEAEQVDGTRHLFQRGWAITEEDSSIYAGEVAMTPQWEGWPVDAPAWIASGDLVDIEADRTHPKDNS